MKRSLSTSVNGGEKKVPGNAITPTLLANIFATCSDEVPWKGCLTFVAPDRKERNQLGIDRSSDTFCVRG